MVGVVQAGPEQAMGGHLVIEQEQLKQKENLLIKHVPDRPFLNPSREAPCDARDYYWT